MNDYRTIFELVLSIVTLVNTAMYWRVMERITKIEEQTKGEIRLLTELHKQSQALITEVKNDLKTILNKL